MSRKSFLRAAGPALLAAALLAGSAGAATPAVAQGRSAGDAADLEWLRQQTVHILVKPSPAGDGAEDNGSGVVVCQYNDRVYVVTAAHVLFGPTQSGRVRSSTTLGTSEIRVSFYQGVAREVVEEPQSEERSDVFTKTRLGTGDLLLLSFPIPEHLAARAAFGKTPSPTELASPQGAPGSAVRAIGYSTPTAKSWLIEEGGLTGRNGEFLVHDAKIVRGFSGGPLFDRAGALIGIDVQEIAEDGHSSGGLAIPVDVVASALRNQLPAACFANEDEESQRVDAAHAAYRKALRQVSFRDWDGALAELKKARDNREQDGGKAVHLQGMRYTDYLPNYYLGLVYYHKGDCGEALNWLGISEVQSVIKGNKRARHLKKMTDRCLRRSGGGSQAG